MGDVPSNTLTTYGLTGNREDIVDEVSIITRIDSPFYHAIGTSTVTAMKHEFMTDAIETPGQNKAKIGSDPTIEASEQPVKLFNYVQLQEKSFSIADSSEAVNTVGNSGGYDYQKALKMKAIVGDAEWAFLREVAVEGNAATEPSMKGMLNWVTTNLNKADDATLNADGTVTGGTAREFTRELVKDVLQDVYSAGGGGQGKMMTSYCGSVQKDKFDAFAATGNNRRAIQKDTVDDKVDLYITSWGTVKAEIHRTMPTDVFVILDLSYWKKATLIPMGIQELARSSRSNRKFHMTVQHTLEAKNELSAGRITNLTTL